MAHVPVVAPPVVVVTRPYGTLAVAEGVTGWLAQLSDFASNPPNPNQIIDVGQNGVGVAPLPVQQRTRIGSFAGSDCSLRP